MDYRAYPIVKLPGSETWVDSYEWGEELERLFPDIDPYDFSAACRYNDMGPAADNTIIAIRMLQQGEGDAEDWIWEVDFDNGETWTMTGWCDYTGWDCQSSNTWEKKN